MIRHRANVGFLDAGQHRVQDGDPDGEILTGNDSVLPVRHSRNLEHVGVRIQKAPGERERAAVCHTGVAGEVDCQDL